MLDKGTEIWGCSTLLSLWFLLSGFFNLSDFQIPFITYDGSLPAIWDLLWVTLWSNGSVVTRKLFVLVHSGPLLSSQKIGWQSNAAWLSVHPLKTLVLQSKSEMLTLHWLLSLCYAVVCDLLGSHSLLLKRTWWAPAEMDVSSSSHCFSLEGSHCGECHSTVLLSFCKSAKVNSCLMLALSGPGSDQLILSWAGGEPLQFPVIYLPLTQWVNPCLHREKHGSG